MFIHDTLSPKELSLYRKGIRNSHLIRYIVQVLDENEDPLGSLTLPHDSRLLSGQRDIDTTQGSSAPTRTLTMDMLDRERQIALNPNSPSEYGVYANRFLRCFRGTYIPGLQRWIDTAIFTGPITTFRYDQERTHLDAQGKEFLFLAPHLMWTVMSFRKGARITDVIHDILYRKGQRKFDFPVLDNPLPKHLSVGRHQEPWPVAQRLAHSINRHLYFDGLGVARMRKFPRNPQWDFTDGPEGTILERPSLTFDHTSIRNLVEVLGPKPSGKKQKRIRAVARLPESHPMSAQSLAWNTEERYLVEPIDIEAPSPPDKSDKEKKKQRVHEALIHRQQYADDLADRKLKELSRESLTAEATVLPVGDLEEMDVVSFSWDGEYYETVLKQSSLPFHENGMTIGSLRRVPVLARARRRNRPNNYRGDR